MRQDWNTPLPDGTLLENRYRVRGLLGQGGMSRVYLADDVRLAVRVAVKENLQTTPEARTQFEAEAQMLARLAHSNLPRVSDHFTDRATGRQYLVMDYIEGEDLEAMVKRVGPLNEQTALAWIRQILDALEYLHAQNPPVVHRDIKPSNIKITPQGKAVLVDFGIAKTFDPRLGTLTGARAFTPGYAPPEQYGLRTTPRSDIYALGATLYTVLTGRVPPEAPLRMSGEEQLIPPSRAGVRVSPATENTILRAMEVQTTQRWQNAADFQAALQGRAGAAESRTVASPRRAPLEPRRMNPIPWLLGLGGAGFILLLVFIGLSGIWAGAPPITPTVAPTTLVANVPTFTLAPPTASPVIQTVVVVVTTTRVPATEIVIPTATQTAIVTSTYTTTETSSSTPTRPLPTSTTTQTVPSSVTTSSTPKPATATMTRRPVTQTRRPNTAIPVSSFIYPPPIPFDPPNDSSLSGNTILRWNSNQELSSNQVYDVLVWPEGTTPRSIGTTQDTKFSIEFRTWGYPSSGKFFWQVRVIQIGGGYLSGGVPPLSFTVSEGNSSGGGQGGGNEPPPPPPPPPDPTEPKPTKCPKTGC